ncbi:heme A synthase [Emticicia sp. BO119]|uniref:COX15/CtaA family protein n=1 Tax=Emticicia sp. BO119 TaxID=2757768 RepID=UPI0015EFF586|nr:COX15/CtaA family protein [Emticicia sp. BO119]MBA4850677.1 COX15/CtaA family protein [Emticicia sp. BO119]
MVVFRKLGVWTIGAVYVLILVGGIVRATGSGMGCPDWPKCFGSWVPPTDISQLPINYKEIFGAKLKGEVEFNAIKTWTEYINRLVGVLIGFFVFATFITSIRSFWNKDRTIVWLSFLAFILVGFEGWLGSKVVSSELHPVMITLHMLLSVIIVFILLYAVARSYTRVIEVEDIKESSSISFLLTALILVTLGQVLLGTQVREMVDHVANMLGEQARAEWAINLGGKFEMHRWFSFIVLGLHILFLYRILKSNSQKGLIYQFSIGLIILIAIEMVTGLILGYLGLPAYAQPIHLTIAILMLGVQFILYLLLNKERVFRGVPEFTLK